MSKRPPELGDTISQVVDTGYFFTVHWLLLVVVVWVYGSYLLLALS